MSVTLEASVTSMRRCGPSSLLLLSACGWRRLPRESHGHRVEPGIMCGCITKSQLPSGISAWLLPGQGRRVGKASSRRLWPQQHPPPILLSGRMHTEPEHSPRCCTVCRDRDLRASAPGTAWGRRWGGDEEHVEWSATCWALGVSPSLTSPQPQEEVSFIAVVPYYRWQY